MKAIVAIVLYLCAAFLTGGYYYNHRCGETYTCGMDAVVTGIGAPLYWAGRAAIEVTK